VPRSWALSRCCLSWLLASVLSPLLGCGHPNKRYDLIEAELRTRNRELSDTRAALEQAQNLNRAYAEAQCRSGSSAPDPTTPAYIPIKEISLARGTGGVDEDGVPGDEGLMVVILPRDGDGAAVKVPAKVQIAAWEVTTAGLKNPIGTWDLPAEKVRPTWRSGFISTGYFVAVPWQTLPCTEKVRVAVRLTTLDGRAFEADKDIFVRVGGGGPRPANPVSQPSPTPAPKGPREPLYPDPIPPGTEELPLPSRTSNRGTVLLPPVRE
jgi:hypothetical protein